MNYPLSQYIRWFLSTCPYELLGLRLSSFQMMSFIFYFCVWKSWPRNKVIDLPTISFRYGSNVLTKLFYVQSYRDVEILVCVFCSIDQDSRFRSMSFCYLWLITTKYGIKSCDGLGRSESCLLPYSNYSPFFFFGVNWFSTKNFVWS